MASTAFGKCHLAIHEGNDTETADLLYKTIKSPVGMLKLVASDRGLAAILWENDDPKRVRLGPLTERKNHPVLLETERQLKDYFAGETRKIFFAARFCRDRVSKESMAGPGRDSLRQDSKLWRDRPADWTSHGRACRRRSDREKSDLDRHPMPPRDWLQRQADRIRGRTGLEGFLAENRIDKATTEKQGGLTSIMETA